MLLLANKNLLKTVVFVLLAVTILNMQRSHAQLCEPDQRLYEKVQDAWKNLDIRRTVVNMTTSIPTDGLFNLLANGSPNDFGNCSAYVAGIFSSAGVDLGVDTTNCNPDPAICEGILNTYSDTQVNITSNPLVQNRVSGSLLGMAYSAEAGIKEPIPVNLAYYWNDSISKVPFFNTALAQEVTYSSVLLDNIFVLWKFFRNLAYAILAIIMLVIGFMIMMRRRISQQAVVTVQYALPKIVIALILITFSYPIGAVIASGSWQLMWNASSIITSEVGSSFNELQFLFTASGASLISAGIGLIVLLIFAQTVTLAGVGLVILVATAIAIAIVIILYIILAVRIFFIYLKLIFSIIASPLIFAVSAIPGNDDKTVEWFKKMAAMGLSLPAMTGILALTQLLATFVLVDSLAHAHPVIIFGGALIGVLVAPFILVFGFFTAWKMPAAVEALIVGPPKRK